MNQKKKNSIILVLSTFILISILIQLFGINLFGDYNSIAFWIGYFISYPYLFLVLYFFKGYDYNKDKSFFWITLVLATFIGFSTTLFYLFFTLMWIVFPLSFLITALYYLKIYHTPKASDPN